MTDRLGLILDFPMLQTKQRQEKGENINKFPEVSQVSVVHPHGNPFIANSSTEEILDESVLRRRKLYTSISG